MGLLLALMLVVATQPVQAATERLLDVKTVNVPLFKSRVLQLDKPVAKISVGNEEVADILVMRSGQVYVLGKGIGTTNILIWDRNNRLIQSVDVEVTPDLNSLKSKLFQLLPGEDVRVNMSQGAIVLSGEVSNAIAMDTAMRLANSFLQKPSKEGASQQGEVINLMSVGGSQQVMLKVTVAEMSREITRKLGIKFHTMFSDDKWTTGAVNGGATFPDAIFGEEGLRTPIFGENAIWGPVLDEFAPGGFDIADKGLFTSYLDDKFLFSLAIDASKENGLTKILAEPTLTALSGQEAEFLSGGEFPIPVPQGTDGITIEFKEFGVGLKFVPVVLDSGRINLKFNVSVSELSSATNVLIGDEDINQSFLVPSLTKRSARSTVELGDGQTIGIAGLLSENMRDVVNKFPGLGDIPILGHLFRSQEFEKGESELVILVTPVLAQPFIADELVLPGDGFIEPTDAEFYLLGKTHHVVGEDDQPSETGDSSSAESTEGGAFSEPTDMAAPPAEPEVEDTAAVSYGVEVAPLNGGMESKYGHSIN
ncbi:type II and III secretion system protein family protein [Marinobacterium arenosum]|uniref:type II and III secretion system protein family protein n=1 Tax=Marinobacterium arenosum TaxID=2862496 RepID=UPI0021074395|nr:type II and III secretion system protein family protein [Marinobacterium arenosum]